MRNIIYTVAQRADSTLRSLGLGGSCDLAALLAFMLDL